MKYTLFFCCFLVLFSCGSEETPSTIQLAGPTVKVVTSTLSQDTQQPSTSIRLNGQVRAKEEAMISTRVMGTIMQVNVDEGQAVRQGQVLARINNSDLLAQQARIQAQIKAAEAAQKNVVRNYERFKKLFEQKSVTQKELNDVEMQVEVANSQVTAAKEGLNELNVQLGYATITAPFSGRIAKKMATKGNLAHPGMPLFTLESSGNLQVVVFVPASEINEIKLNDQVNIFRQESETPLVGKVSLINPSAAHSGNQYKVEISLAANNRQGLLSGMNVSVALPKMSQASEGTALWIPKTALVQQGQLRGVYTVSSQKTALLRWLQLGEERAEQVEVVAGLSPSDVLIVSATGKLYNGVNITE